ncbi:hypothetical protein B0H17DRAFT_1077402, partial [Mycena rosella]
MQSLTFLSCNLCLCTLSLLRNPPCFPTHFAHPFFRHPCTIVQFHAITVELPVIVVWSAPNWQSRRMRRVCLCDIWYMAESLLWYIPVPWL